MFEEPKIGDKLKITGKHPHAGKHGEIIAFEKIYALRKMAVRIKCEDGSECFVFNLASETDFFN